MAGIYIHIPFCRQACHYCDFHFSTTLNEKERMVNAILKELELRKDYIGNEIIETIYLGGGTPSLLESNQIELILEKANKLFEISRDAEITLEANPDDLVFEKIRKINKTRVNRLSIGIQSFFDDDLKYFNRIHTAKEGINSIKMAQDAGFENITIDLIYGFPGLTIDKWIKNLETGVELNIPHISCYCLTVEKGTALDHFIKTKKLPPLDEDLSNKHFEILMQFIYRNNYEQYEISNFCKDGRYSKHNTSYWKGETYLGIGPSAHSYNKKSRQWNVSNNFKYMQQIETGTIPCEIEENTPSTSYNDYILTSLRTQWGSDLNYISKNFGRFFAEHFLLSIEKEVENLYVNKNKNIFTLTDKGKYFADRIASDLFILKAEINESNN